MTLARGRCEAAQEMLARLSLVRRTGLCGVGLLDGDELEPELLHLPERRYETPTFSPRSAFATRLRSVEVARRERKRQSFSRQPDVLACAA